MMKFNLKAFSKNATTTISRKSPEIYLGLGLTGMGVAIVEGIRKTPMALREIDRFKEEIGIAQEDNLTNKEIIQATWKCYWPTAALFLTSSLCLVASYSKHTKRTAAMATMYRLSDAAFREYKDKVKETFGEEKEKVIQEKVNEDKVNRASLTPGSVIVTGKGETIFIDAITNQPFKTDKNSIDKAVNNLNFRMLSEMYISLNEFYQELGIPSVSSSVGDYLGWNIYRDGQIELDYHAIINDRGEACIIVDFLVRPRENFQSLN